MTRSSAEVEAEVEAQRGRLDRTVEALKDKMTPSEIFDETASALSGVGQQMLSSVVEQAKRNPMPLAVMGVGLVWMLASSNSGRAGSSSSYRSRSYGSGYGTAYGSGYGEDSAGGSGLRDKFSDMTDAVGDRAHRMASQVGDAAQQAQDRAQGAVSDLKDKLSDAADQARQGVQSARDSLMTKGRSAAGTATETGRWMSQRAGEIVDGEPLLLAGLGLAVGLAIGSALPSTDIEDRTMGHTRDQLLEKGKALAQETLQDAGEAAQKAYDAAKDELAPDAPRETV
ncbi:MAG TPA: DUF3618 domain-containing protein [Caulobacteraceae bacterium]|jgi:F0F1-type ATP synthase membrane subunit b/b'|nr:DUF3618 domain-containing protein [Caulobacteraceae bacterium]